ncbi:MAG TPA: MFS transporter [Actinomycetes bacterium]
MGSQAATGEGTTAGAMRPGLLLAALLLVALNLRAALASIPPLVPAIEADLGLSGAAAGALTTLPVLCMGLFAPPAHRMAQRFGREAAIVVALVLLLAGFALRLAGSFAPALFLAVLLGGIGIAVAGTVLPGVVKEFFPERSGTVTGFYLAAMMVGATAASALAVPLAAALGSWQASIASWGILAVVALAAWLPVLRKVNEREGEEAETATHGLPWRSRTAWLVAAYLTANSVLFYSLLAWIAPAYESFGWTGERSGLLLAEFSVVQLLSALTIPIAADRMPDRRPLFGLVVGMAVVGLVVVTWVPMGAPWVWIAILGYGLGGGFTLGLALLVDYAPDPSQSAGLSAMAFLVSYTIAAAGPLLLGALRDATGGFRVPFLLLLVTGVLQLGLVTRLRPGRSVA